MRVYIYIYIRCLDIVSATVSLNIGRAVSRTPRRLSGLWSLTLKTTFGAKYVMLSLSLSIYLSISLSLSIYIYIHMCVCMCVYIYIYLYTSIHVYIHIRSASCARPSVRTQTLWGNMSPEDQTSYLIGICDRYIYMYIYNTYIYIYIYKYIC